MDDQGNPITGLNRQVRDGQRLILVIATTRWGPIVVRDEDGLPIIDRAWEGAGRRFVELNRFCMPRALTEDLVNDQGEFDDALLKKKLTGMAAEDLQGLRDCLDGRADTVYGSKVQLGPLSQPPLPNGTPVVLRSESEDEGEDEDAGSDLERSTSLQSTTSNVSGTVQTILGDNWEYEGTITGSAPRDHPVHPYTYTFTYHKDYNEDSDDEASFSTGAVLDGDMFLDLGRDGKKKQKEYELLIRAPLEDVIFRRIRAIYDDVQATDAETYAPLTEADRLYLGKMWDLAPTTEMMFVAGQSKGDYHKNMDSRMFLKWTKRLEIAYPIWCEQMEELRSTGNLYPAVPEGDNHRFWDEEKNEPARKLYLLLDNASYHHGGEVNVMTWGKLKCADELRRLKITSIKIRPMGEPATEPAPEAEAEAKAEAKADKMEVEVEAKAEGGAPMDAAVGEGGGMGEDKGEGEGEALGPGQDSLGYFVRVAVPSGKQSFIAKGRAGGYDPVQVARATLEAIKREAPGELVQSVRAIFQAHGWGLIWTPPYTSPWCWIEHYWLSGKCYVAAPSQQRDSRQLSDVAEQLDTKWYGLDYNLSDHVDDSAQKEILFKSNKYTTDTSKHIDQCLDLMDGWIKKDKLRGEENGHEGYLIGKMNDDETPLMWCKGGQEHEITAELFAEWYEMAGVSASAQEEALEMAFNADLDQENEDSDSEEDEDIEE